MSFNSEYMALRKKRKQGGVNADLTEYQEKAPTMLYSSADIKPKYELDDIAPVKTSTKASAPSALEGIAPVKEDNRTWFQKGAFEDGYQFGDVLKTINATGSDLRASVTAGILGIGEKVVDASAYLGGAATSLFLKGDEKEQFKREMGEWIAKDLYDEKEIAKKIVNYTTPETAVNSFADKAMEDGEYNGFTKWVANNIGNYDIEGDSVLGEKADDLAYSGGQLIGTMALQGVGVPWWLTTGVTSFGAEAENAFKQDATYGEAGFSAAISAGAEILSEKLVGGSGLGENAIVKKATKGVASKGWKLFWEYGKDIVGEGAEEVFSEFMSTLGSQLSYEREETIEELFTNEEAMDDYLAQLGDSLFGEEARKNYGEAFVGGAVLGGVASGGKAINSIATGKDYTTGLTENDTKVFDHEYQKRIAEKEQKGELSKKDKAKIYAEVMEDLQNGTITTDTIEEVLGGENYTAYKDASAKAKSLVDTKNALVKQYADMIKSGNTENAVSERDLAKQIYDMQGQIAEATEVEKAARKNLSDYMSKSLSRMRGKRIVEDGIARGYRDAQTQFKVDTTAKYSAKQREMLEKIADKKVINNTRGAHKFWEMATGVAADRGFDLEVVTTDEIIKMETERFTKKLGSAEAAKAKVAEMFGIENGKVTKVPNGYEIGGGKIAINAESRAAREFTFGHEIMHTLTDSKHKAKLKELLFAKAEADEGEAFAERVKATEERYSGVEKADPHEEILCDLVGKYVYGDSDFIYNELTKDKNLFQRVWDEVKYLCKMATTGSKEERDLLRIEREFEKAYREKIKPSENSDTDAEYSLVEDKATIDFLENQDHITVYKAMSLVDGKLYPPMASQNYVDEEYTTKKGEKKTRRVRKLKNPSVLGKWQQAEERPDLIKSFQPPSKKYPDGYGKFDLLKSNGKTTGGVAYNPYEHTSNIVLNDQFSEAYQRPELVTVEYQIPVSELTSGYKAQHAKDAVGLTDWKAGGVAQKLQNSHRDVYLTRWSKPIRVLSDAEVAQKYKEILDKEDGISVPWNVVTPSLRTELEKIGVPIDYSDIKAGDTIRTFEAAMRGDYTEKSKDANYSLSDSDGNALTEEQGDYFKDSKVRDENGNLKVLYHGTKRGGFTVFEDTDDIGYFFTDRETNAGTYSGTYTQYAPKRFDSWDEAIAFAKENDFDLYYDSDTSEYVLSYDWGESRWAESELDAIADELNAILYGDGEEVNYAVYLNLVDPLIINGNGSNWDNVIDHYEGGEFVRYEELTEEQIQGFLDNGYEEYDLKPFTDNYGYESLPVFDVVNFEISYPMTTREWVADARDGGFDGVIFKDILDSGSEFGSYSYESNVYVALNPNQIKSVANEHPTEDPDIRYSLSSITNSFFGDPDMPADVLQKTDYKQTEGYKTYVASCLNNMRQTRADFDEESAKAEIEAGIDGIIRVAIAAKKAGYDIPDYVMQDGKKVDVSNLRDGKGRMLFSSLEPNSEYTTSHDVSAICDKRKNFGEIYDDITKAEEKKGVPKGKRFFDKVDNYFYLHKVLADKGLTTPCEQCYVDTMRKNLTPMANAFVELVGEENADNLANKQLYEQGGKKKGQLKTGNAEIREKVRALLAEYGWSVGDLTMTTLTSADGLARLKLQAPLVYEAFNSFYGQSKPKMPREATPFRFGELTAFLTDHNGKIKQGLVDKINSTGGFRLQSYSDFQIENFVDVLQTIFEASTLGLSGHAYTKVPAFIDATEGTNLKRNISIFMYKDGNEWKIDRNDSFPYTLEEIYDIVNADETGNTSIIAVSQNADMSALIMANDNIGQGIPFHKSGAKMGVVRETVVRENGREIKGYRDIKDHTRQQTEVWKHTTADHNALTKVKKGIDIYKFWDFDNADGLSKNKLIEKNVKRYIDECEKAGYIPKFREYVMNNEAVLNGVLKYAKKFGFVSPDATIDDISFKRKGYTIPYGYYKFLGDFGMFTPDGEASPHKPLSLANYNFDNAVKYFDDAEALQRKEILQQFANGEERAKYEASDLTAGQLKDIIKQKRAEVVDEVVGQLSLSDATDGELLGDVYKEGLEAYNRQFVDDSVAPVVDNSVDEAVDEAVATVVQDEEVAPTPTEQTESPFPKWADNEVAAYKHYIAEDRANAKPRKKPLFSALKRLVVTKPKGKVEHHGVLTSDGKQYMTCNGVFVAEMNAPDKSIIENEKLAVDTLKGILANANANAIEGNYTIDPIDISLIRKQVNNSDKNVVIVGDNVYDIRYVDAVLQAIENPTISLTPFRGLNALLVKGSNGQAVIMPIDHRTGADKFKYVYKAESNVIPENVAPTPASEEDAHAAQNIESLTDADAPAEVEAPMPETEPKTAENPFEERDYKGVGDRKVKAFMAENPEVKSFFQEEARVMLGELQNTTKGERWYDDEVYYASGGEKGWSGTERLTTDDIAYLLDNGRGNGKGYTYAEIEKGLMDIIEDNGRENHACAKRIEFLINDRLMKGHKDIDGVEIPPNQEYIDLLNDLEKKQNAEAAPFEAKDADAPVTTNEAPLATSAAAKAEPIKTTNEAPVKNEPTKDETPESTIDKILDPRKEKQFGDKVREELSSLKKLFHKARTAVIDKQSAIEDVALKTKNRRLMGLADFMHRSESRAQEFIKKNLKPILDKVEQSGKRKEFGDYAKHLLNMDRQSLDTPENIARREELRKQFKGMNDKQIRSIAHEWIRKDTAQDVADRIRAAREYVDLLKTKNKAVFGDSYTAEMSRKVVAEYEAKNPEFKAWVQEVYDVNNMLRQMLVDANIISQETADLWAKMYPHYIPLKRAGKDGKAITVPLDTNKTGVNTPIKRATGGDSATEDLFDTIGDRVMQVMSAVARNNFGLELMHTIDTATESTATNIDEVLDSFSAENDELLKKGEDGALPTFTVFENGKRVTFDITEELYDALKASPEWMSKSIPIASQLASLQRGLLTQYNLLFIPMNAIKDFQDVLMNSQHAARTYANMPLAIKELTAQIFGNGGKWITEYAENGGISDLSYYDKRGRYFTKEDSGLKKVIGFAPREIAAINDFIEQIPRLAEYIASRKMGKSIEEAMLDAARVTTNFAAGGDLTKFANRNGFTFLNASIQGFNQQIRNIREARANGVKGVMQLATKFAIAGLPAMLLNHLLWDDDEDYAELSDYVKDNYYIVGKTEEGRFIRIPKGRAVAVIQSAFEQMQNLITGDDEVDFARFGELLVNNLAPNNPLENNIIAPLWHAATNKTWYGDELVPQRLQNLPNEEQYDETTDSISRWLGETFGWSPYKVNYVLDQYSGGIGDIVLPYLTPESDGGGMGGAFYDKFTTDPILKNQNVSDFYDTKDELEKSANSMHATDADKLRYMYFNAVNGDLADLYQMKREIQSNPRYSDAQKSEKVRKVQEQIVELTRDALDSKDNVRIQGKYATVGGKHYRWYEPSDDSEAEAGWRKITDDQLEKQNEVTSALGITPSQYWENKEEYDYAYDHPDRYAISQAVGGFDIYQAFMDDLNDIYADKDEDGKSIVGSRKEKVLDYINGLDADYGAKLIIFKSQYKADDTYNWEIIDYLNSRQDISYSQMETILKALGFKVSASGNVSW